jgi:hypothetical protein
MTAERRKLYEQKGNLSVGSALKEAENFMVKAGRTQEEDFNLKALYVKNERLLD